MSDGTTLLSVTGLKAQVLKAALGAPFLLVGTLLVLSGVGSPDPKRAVLLAGIGAVLLLFGALAFVEAIRDDELTVTVGGESSVE